MKKIVKIKREDVIEMFSNVDGWDMETLISYAEDNLKEFYSSWTNKELLEELNQRGDLEPGKYNPFDIEEDYDIIHIVSSVEKNEIENDFDVLEKIFIQQVKEDLNSGDHTAISEMLRLLVSDEKSFEIIKAYLPE